MSNRPMLHVHLTPAVHRALKVRATTDGLTIQAWVTRVLTAALGGLKKGEPSALARKGGRLVHQA